MVVGASGKLQVVLMGCSAWGYVKLVHPVSRNLYLRFFSSQSGAYACTARLKMRMIRAA